MRISLLLCLFFSLISCKKQAEINQLIWIDQAKLYVQPYETTVGDFAEFINQTGYETTNDLLGWGGVFNPLTMEWEIKHNVNWKYPISTKKEAHALEPVTQVSYFDACAYCEWKGGRLPTASEWNEIAGKVNNKGNTWEGEFPYHDSGTDGYKAKVAKVGNFEPNDFGLYDVFGNVWEWTSTPKNDSTMIIKGGSFLCAPNYCSGYVPERFQTSILNTSLNHLGFRCVFSQKPIQ